MHLGVFTCGSWLPNVQSWFCTNSHDFTTEGLSNKTYWFCTKSSNCKHGISCVRGWDVWFLEQGCPDTELRGLPEYLSNLHLCNSFTNVCTKLYFHQYVAATKEKESRGTSDTSLALLVKQHSAMASSSQLTRRLPVSIAGTVAVFQLWQALLGCSIHSSSLSHSSESVVTAVRQSLDTATCTARLSGWAGLMDDFGLAAL